MADSDDPELDVNVRVSQEGASEAESAVKEVGDAAKDAGDKAADSMHEAAHGMREFTGSTREGQEAVRGIQAAFEGGARGVGEMIRGLRAMTLITAHLVEGGGPLGLLLLAVGTIAGAVLALSRHTKEAGEEMDKGGEKAEKFAKSVEAAAAVVKISFKGMADDVRELIGEMESLDKMQEVAEARDKRLATEQQKTKVAQETLDEQKGINGARSGAIAAGNKAQRSSATVLALQANNASQEDIDAAQAIADKDMADFDKARKAAQREEEHIKTVFEARRKIEELDKESDESSNTVRSAKVEADRADARSGDLSNRELESSNKRNVAQAAFQSAKEAAAKANAESIAASALAASTEAKIANASGKGPYVTESEKIVMDRLLGDQEQKAAEAAARAKALSRDALIKQGEASAAEKGDQSVQAEVAKGRDFITKADEKLKDAQALDEEKQKQIAIEKQIQQQIAYGKANDDATTALGLLAAAAREATKALDAVEKERDANNKKDKPETDKEKRAQQAEDNHLTDKGERAFERMSAGTEKSKKALATHAETTAAAHEDIARKVTGATKHIERTSRQLINAPSFDSSP